MKYKYLKGSAEDFDGAPDWALQVYKGSIRCFVGAMGQWKNEDSSRTYCDFEQCAPATTELTAERQMVTETEGVIAESTNPTEALITERSSRYGKLKGGAEIMQSLKDTMRDVDGWNNLTASQKEALDMIQHKIGRILNGDPTYDDSWKDIAGYATLIVNELNGEVR